MASRAELLYEAWSTGNLEYLCHEYQLPLYHDLWGAILNKKTLKHVVNISRRWGKTHCSSIVAVEFAIRYPNSVINYAAPTNKEMQKILRSIMGVIFQECPSELKPRRVGDSWHFPNGSIIYTAGVNNGHADDLRGGSSHLNIVDEAGQIDELEYLVRSVLMPMQLTVNGTLLMLSTPPTVTDHDYAKFYHEAKEDGDLTEFTIYDNALVMADKEKFNAYVTEAGGEESTTWKREYLCQFVTDTNKIIIPEWAAVKENCVRKAQEDPLLRFYFKYAGMDLGFKDFTVQIFGYYDFRRAKLVIQREAILIGEAVTSQSIFESARDIESELWGPKANVTRISDNNNPILLNDIASVHNQAWSGTSKDDLIAMVNNTKLWIGAGKVEIDPSCEHLLGCLEFAVWDRQRKGFAHSKKYGHYDGLAALIYMLRYIDVYTNPVPTNLSIPSVDLMLPVEEQTGSSSAEGLRRWAAALNTKSRKGLVS